MNPTTGGVDERSRDPHLVRGPRETGETEHRRDAVRDAGNPRLSRAMNVS